MAGRLLELLADELADRARVRLAAGLLHHLADEEAEQALLAALVGGDLAGIRVEDPGDDRLQLGRVGDGLLREVRRGREARLRDLAERLVERGARDPVARLDELRQLRGIDRVAVDAGEPVRDQVRGGEPARRRPPPSPARGRRARR